MTKKNAPTSLAASTVQKEFLQWYEAEKKNGLKDIKFFPGDVSQATVDLFILESKAIDQAIKDGRHAPLPSDI